MGQGDDKWELLGGEDVADPGIDGLLWPVGDADTGGHVLDQMVSDVDVECTLGLALTAVVLHRVEVFKLPEECRLHLFVGIELP